MLTQYTDKFLYLLQQLRGFMGHSKPSHSDISYTEDGFDSPWVEAKIVDGICEVKIKKGQNPTVENIEILSEAYRKIHKGKRLPYLADISEIGMASSAARDKSAQDKFLSNFSIMAIIARKPVAASLANLYLKFSKPSIPARVFHKEEHARAWLEKEIQFLKEEPEAAEPSKAKLLARYEHGSGNLEIYDDKVAKIIQREKSIVNDGDIDFCISKMKEHLGSGFKLFVDARKMLYMTTAARKRILNLSEQDGLLQISVLVNSRIVAVISSLMMKVSDHQLPIRTFYSKDLALDWLRDPHSRFNEHIGPGQKFHLKRISENQNEITFAPGTLLTRRVLINLLRQFNLSRIDIRKPLLIDARNILMVTPSAFIFAVGIKFPNMLSRATIVAKKSSLLYGIAALFSRLQISGFEFKTFHRRNEAKSWLEDFDYEKFKGQEQQYGNERYLGRHIFKLLVRSLVGLPLIYGTYTYMQDPTADYSLYYIAVPAIVTIFLSSNVFLTSELLFWMGASLGMLSLEAFQIFLGSKGHTLNMQTLFHTVLPLLAFLTSGGFLYYHSRKEKVFSPSDFRQTHSILSALESISRFNFNVQADDGLRDTDLDLICRTLNKVQSEVKLVFQELDKSQKQIQESEERVEVIANALPVVIAKIDAKGQILFANTAFRKFASKIPEDPFSKLDDFFDDDLIALIDKNRNLDRNGSFEYTRDTFGEVRNYEFTIIQTDGNDSDYILLGTDFTERRKTEQQLEDAQAQVVQSSKLASLGEMAAGLAHEIHNPIQSIRGFNELIERKTIDPDKVDLKKVRDYSQRIHENCQRVVDIVEHFRNFSRVNHASKAAVSVNQVAERALTFFNQQLKISGIELEWTPPQFEVFVEANETQMEQILVNLISNARDAIVARHGRFGGRLSIALCGDEDEVKLTVRDNGTGVDEKTKQKIFDPFFTTKPPGKGTGLGLSIIHGLIADHNGTMEFNTELGKGSEIVLRFPPLVNQEKNVA